MRGIINIKTSSFSVRQRGLTLIEVIIASGIALIIAAALAFLILFAGKSEAVLAPQMARQNNALRAIQICGDLLRNAYYDSIEIPSENIIEFESPELPEGQVARIKFQGGTLVYYPDKTETNEFRTIANGLTNVTFAWESNEQAQRKMVKITVIFKYRKYRGYNQSEAEKLNGTFATKIYPRN